MKLLLIDDDARLTAMLSEYLTAAGFEVASAGSLKAGRQLLAEGNHDLLVLDLMLPDGDGLDFCRELRAHPQTRRLPVLMLSARGESRVNVLQDSDTRRCSECRAAGGKRYKRFHHCLFVTV